MQIIIEIQDKTKAFHFIQFLEQIPYIKIDRNINNIFEKKMKYDQAKIHKFKGLLKNSSINELDWYNQ